VTEIDDLFTGMEARFDRFEALIQELLDRLDGRLPDAPLHRRGLRRNGRGGRLMAKRERRRAAELQKLRVEQLDRLDFRFESMGPALAKMAQHAERSIRRMLTT
jgi:hypothetical protein